MANKPKIAAKKAPRIDRQISRFIEFRHRNPPLRSCDTARPFDYLNERELRVLIKTFEAFELDINDPAQRDHVLACLAYSIFGDEERGAGRPRGSKTWNTAAKLNLINQINGAIKSIVDETGEMPRTMWAIVEKIAPSLSRQRNGNLYNRVCQLYRLQKNKKK